jgi:hypothetical protein
MIDVIAAVRWTSLNTPPVVVVTFPVVAVVPPPVRPEVVPPPVKPVSFPDPPQPKSRKIKVTARRGPNQRISAEYEHYRGPHAILFKKTYRSKGVVPNPLSGVPANDF